MPTGHYGMYNVKDVDLKEDLLELDPHFGPQEH